MEKYLIECNEVEVKLLTEAATLQSMNVKEFIKHSVLFEAREDLDFKRFMDEYNAPDAEKEDRFMFVRKDAFQGLNTIMVYAFRYALGRRTYAVSDVCKFIEQHVNELTEKDRDLIIREINTASLGNGLGDACDSKMWWDLEKHLKEYCCDK